VRIVGARIKCAPNDASSDVESGIPRMRSKQNLTQSEQLLKQQIGKSLEPTVGLEPTTSGKEVVCLLPSPAVPGCCRKTCRIIHSLVKV